MDSAIEQAVVMQGVSVSRSGWLVLQNIDWELRFGEIHALIGEHRSGKSTLAGLISGEAAKDGGELIIGARRIETLSPRQARAMGVSVIGQESRLIQSMTVAENILLGCRSFQSLSKRRMAEAASRYLDQLGVFAPPLARVRDLPNNLQRLVELAKATVDDPRILILDEPTQRFTPDEMELVHEYLKAGKAQGRSALYISPTLDEALEIADRVTFISAGVIQGTELREKLDRFRILNLTFPALASRENLRQANIELYNYKRYNESLIRNLPIGVVIVDTENRVNMLNEAASAILRRDRAAAAGKNLAEIFPAETVAALGLDGNKLPDSPEDLDIHDTPVRLTIFPLRDEENAVLGQVILLVNIAIDQRLKEYLVRVEKIKSAATLAAGIAHEINNPLFVIRNYVELLKRQPDSSEVPKRLHKIGAELDWIVEIVGSMLSFAKPGEEPMAEVDLAAVLADVLLLGYRFRDSDIEVQAAIEHTPLPVLGSANRLKQFFVNILNNGIDAAGRGGAVKVTASRCQNGDYVEVVIEDNGPGIPDEVREEIFNPFFTTKTTRHNTGLGLSICQQIVEAHNGILLVDRKDSWTRFALRLPACGESCQ